MSKTLNLFFKNMKIFSAIFLFTFFSCVNPTIDKKETEQAIQKDSVSNIGLYDNPFERSPH